MDYTVKESGLQLDQPPAVGNISSLAVVILKNDNAEGILEFRQDYVNITGKNQNKGTVMMFKSCKCSSKAKTQINLYCQTKFDIKILFAICKIPVLFWLSFFQLRRMWALC